MLQDVRGGACRLSAGSVALMDAHARAIDARAPGSSRVIRRLIGEAIDTPVPTSARFLETLRELGQREATGGRGFTTRQERRGLAGQNLGNASKYGYIEPVPEVADPTARRLTEAGRARANAGARIPVWLHSSILGCSLLARPEFQAFRETATHQLNCPAKIMFGIWFKHALIVRPDPWTQLATRQLRGVERLGTQYLRRPVTGAALHA